MNRRALLISAGISTAVLAGCLGRGASEGSSATETQNGSTDEDSTMNQNSYSIEEYSVSKESNSDLPLQLNSEVVDKYIGPDDPAVILLSITNTSDDPVYLISHPAGVAPFGILQGKTATQNSRNKSNDNSNRPDNNASSSPKSPSSKWITFYNDKYDISKDDPIGVAPEASEKTQIMPSNTIDRSFALPVNQQASSHLRAGSYIINYIQQYTLKDPSEHSQSLDLNTVSMNIRFIIR
jgi:hypothetical protein